MYWSTWNRWMKALDGRSRTRRKAPCRLILTNLESRDVPAAFTPGDIVVYRIGDGSPAPNSPTNFTSTTGNLNFDAAPVFLDEYTPAGVLKQSIELPTTGSGALTAIETSSATGTTNQREGLMTDSADGRFLVIPGYNAPVGTATLYAGNTVRAVDLVGLNGTVISQTVDNLAESNIRSAATADGTVVFSSDYWTTSMSTPGGPMRAQLAGTTGPSTGISTEVNYLTGMTTLNSGSADPAAIEIYNGQLYMSTSQASDDGVNTVGTGLPTTPGNTTTNLTTILPGFPTTGSSGSPAQFPSPEQFVFTNSTTLYVADARVNGVNSGLQKWVLGGNPSLPSSWYNVYTIPMPGTNEGLMSVTYYGTDTTAGPNFGDPIFYGITNEGGATPAPSTSSVQDKLMVIEDNGSAGASTANVLVTAPAATGTNGSTSSQEYFKSVALVPTTPIGATADTVGVATSGSPSNYGAPVTFTATVTGTSAVPTGYITFEDTSTSPPTMLAVVPLTGTTGAMAQAQFTTSSLSVTSGGPSHTIEAVYGGDGNYLSNNNTTSQVVNGAATTTVVTSSNPLPTTAGVVVTFTATVTATSGAAAPTGTVNFYDDGNLINASPVAVTQVGSTLTATATQTETTNPTQGANPILLTPGSHTITAVYTPAGNFVASDDKTSPLIQSVKPNAFGAGDILVYRVGDGINPTNDNTDNVVYIDEYNPSNNTLIQSILMPSFSVPGGNQALTSDTYQASEGELSLSSDGQYVLLTGYDAPPGGSAPDTSASASIPRTIGEISYNGTINTSMALTDAADGGSIRGAASPDGQEIYVAGSTGGVRFVNGYTAGLTTSKQIDTGNNTSASTLAVQNPVIAGGKLYVSDSSTTGTVNPTIKVAEVGAGLPMTAGQSDTTIAGLPDTVQGTNEPSNPLGYFFTTLGTGPFVGPNTLYIANDGTSFYGGDISKWTLVSGTWTLNGVIPSNGTSTTNPATSPPSFNYVTGTVSGNTVNLYATFGVSGTAVGGGGGLYSIVDNTGYNPSYNAFATPPAITVMASESTTSNEIFRGVVAVPTQPVTVASITPSDGVPADGTTQRSEVRQIAVTFSGLVTFAGGNAAAAFQLNQINDTVQHFATPVAVQNLAANVTTVSGQTVVTLTFVTTGNTTTTGYTGPSEDAGYTGPIDSVSAQNGAAPSLSDGRFQLTIVSADVLGPNGDLAGGGPGGNYVSPLDTQPPPGAQLGGATQFGGPGQVGLYRLFGDATGDTPGIDDQLALSTFRGAFNSSSTPPNNAAYLAYLDADNSGIIDQFDLAQFRGRINNSVFV